MGGDTGDCGDGVGGFLDGESGDGAGLALIEDFEVLFAEIVDGVAVCVAHDYRQQKRVDFNLDGVDGRRRSLRVDCCIREEQGEKCRGKKFWAHWIGESS